MSTDNDILNLIIVATVVILIIHFGFRRRVIDTYSSVREMPQSRQIRSIIRSDKGIPRPSCIDNDNMSLESVGSVDAVYENSSCDFQTTKEFNNNFFSFRDSTFKNSSMTVDPVDKINQLYLSGDLSTINSCKPVKIKDIYDKTTQELPYFQRDCVRTQYYDKTNPEGYLFSFGSPTKGITAYDPEYRSQLDYQVLKNYPQSDPTSNN